MITNISDFMPIWGQDVQNILDESYRESPPLFKAFGYGFSLFSLLAGLRGIYASRESYDDAPRYLFGGLGILACILSLSEFCATYTTSRRQSKATPAVIPPVVSTDEEP